MLINGANTYFFIQGFKREWAPFVLTPDFVYVMGGEVRTFCCKFQPSDLLFVFPEQRNV